MHLLPDSRHCGLDNARTEQGGPCSFCTHPSRCWKPHLPMHLPQPKPMGHSSKRHSSLSIIKFPVMTTVQTPLSLSRIVTAIPPVLNPCCCPALCPNTAGMASHLRVRVQFMVPDEGSWRLSPLTLALFPVSPHFLLPHQ
jgi:hypothetical protein